VVSVALLLGALNCGRTTLEPGNALDGDDGSVLNPPPSAGGSSAVGGSVGVAGADSSAGAPAAAASGPDCAFIDQVEAAPRDSRWLAFRARPSAGSVFSQWLVEVTPDGPQRLTDLGAVEQHEQGAFSGDGRYYAVTQTAGYLPIGLRVYEIGAGSSPVQVAMPADVARLRWAPHGARYLTLIGGTLTLGTAGSRAQCKATKVLSCW
jgi:hypothetical protein